MKKIISVILTLTLILGLAAPVLAVGAGEQRVAVGANLSNDQKKTVYDYFGLEQGSVDELTVTIDDERHYLENVDATRIGSKSLSSIYIITKEEGEGLDITLHNIDWLTKEIYQNALITAGITDAKVIIAAPISVSGTAALTGIYKAYEDITGEKLDEESKQVATEELVTTGDLADDIGSEDAAALVNELKLIIDQLKDMSDDEVREEIKQIAINLNITLTVDQIEQLLQLVRSLEGVNLGSLTSALENVASALGGLSSSGSSGFWGTIVDFFSKIGNFFANLFG